MLDWVKEVLGELAESVAGAVVAIIVFLWWIGGPGLTAILWSEGDKPLAMQFLAGWAVVTVLYFMLSRLVRRIRRG
ncbi:hypothetical protein LRS74_32475 [Streptomyces sp. LX-29]|uniref:hypothetical protein n=1 Tax=Streptomyces sp. LX-29 TaxID=2900152 RepID=UPI00240D4BF6|nr:hypothetical protein [Streptomyces sp. LX-29]WFB11228.1 hypothetical protein LRS74_32475 [Streptomyces sp. LX-29]